MSDYDDDIEASDPASRHCSGAFRLSARFASGKTDLAEPAIEHVREAHQTGADNYEIN
jgi:hypothetical protein